MGNQSNINETQVLNLQELEHVAKIEKESSKHRLIPKIFFGMGLFLIILGIILQVTSDDDNSYTPDESDEVVVDNDEHIDTESFSLICTNTTNDEDLTTIERVTLNFNNELLVDTQTILTLESQSEDMIQSLLLILDPFVESISTLEGINIVINTTETSISVELSVDLSILDSPIDNIELFEEFSWPVEVNNQQPLNEVTSIMYTRGYTCE